MVKYAMRILTTDEEECDKVCDNYSHSESGEKGFNLELSLSPAKFSHLEKYLKKITNVLHKVHRHGCAEKMWLPPFSG